MASYLDDREDYEFLEEYLERFRKVQEASELKYTERLILDFIEFSTFQLSIKEKSILFESGILEQFLEQHTNNQEKDRDILLRYLNYIR